MDQKGADNITILITGGTSGLGLELAKCFLDRGYEVVATGRHEPDASGFSQKFFLYKVDFGDLFKVAETTATICSNHSVGMIINNAGILSPPVYTETTDGLEYTFQINFLAHLLIAEIILRSRKAEQSLVIASVTSPVYKLAGKKPGISAGAMEYNAIRSYSSSKLLLALLHEFLVQGTTLSDFNCFSLNPGTFSSSIYRTQKSWFRTMYRIAAPFMRSPAKVARVMTEIILNTDYVDGMIYDITRRQEAAPMIEKSHMATLIGRCHELIDPYLRKADSPKF
jgi:NAD(P)-dependent dehydrogenase (short-subunit alcohol dehydrogenase family)